MADDVMGAVTRIDMEDMSNAQMIDTVNEVAAACPCPCQWLYYCFNAEYLLFPFCETRSIGEMLAFHAEERRSAMLTYVVDLYAENLQDHSDAVSIDTAMMDKAGYYALARPDPDNYNHPKERQLDFYGGLRWRFEEHVPKAKRKIDRISIFKAQLGCNLRPDFTLKRFHVLLKPISLPLAALEREFDHIFDSMLRGFALSDKELNTYSCALHSNLAAAVCSFRAAKALKTNPGSTYDIKSFKWHNSVPFEWHSRQLMDLGLMEPGQWF